VKIAILSDIHGNIFALESVLSAVKKRGIDTLMIAGDFVGYYFWPKEVFSLLEGWNLVAIRGNHDQMLCKAKKNKDYLLDKCKKYGSGLSIAVDQLDNERLAWLANLPRSIEYKTEDGNILICHGSPWIEDEYVYPDASDESLARYSKLDVNWVIQGHTHYTMHKEIGSIMLINPGSVGQPRNKKPGAQWALLDTNLNKVDFFCEQYDIKKVVEESKKRHPEIPYLANILEKI
jgi:putative phosphoesterase